ncbi:hypothetical protein A6K76_15070 [Caryophanon latum]|uniref:Uncharacterized protein n=1 Tax=Caryophanon latum TaxID=33977 RepID=A0A1C0YEK7_9BACL|nr:hypothetical protein A6K76_15070 [Caryophanon latum]
MYCAKHRYMLKVSHKVHNFNMQIFYKTTKLLRKCIYLLSKDSIYIHIFISLTHKKANCPKIVSEQLAFNTIVLNNVVRKKIFY